MSEVPLYCQLGMLGAERGQRSCTKAFSAARAERGFPATRRCFFFLITLKPIVE